MKLGILGASSGIEDTRVRGVLLDVDGTLLDSNDAHAHAWVEALEGAGVKVDFDRVRRLIGMGGDKLMPEVSGIDPESDVGESISKRRSAVFKARWLPTLKALPGARELLQRMRADGLVRVVATSATKDEIDGLLEAAEVRDLVGDEATSDDAENSKPDPDILHAAIARAGLPARDLVMLGDTPYDLEAAQKAGVPMIAFRSGGWKDADLRGAIAIYDDPADLLAHYEASPFGRGLGRSQERERS